VVSRIVSIAKTSMLTPAAFVTHWNHSGGWSAFRVFAGLSTIVGISNNNDSDANSHSNPVTSERRMFRVFNFCDDIKD
jgi:hypothetical protein